MALPLRKREKLTDASVQGRVWPRWPTDAPLPPICDFLGGEASIAAGLASSPEEAPTTMLDIIQSHNLGGGNPKVVYLNYHLHRAKTSRSEPLSREQVRQLRQEHVRRYDESPHLQARWRGVYAMVRRRRATEAQAKVKAAQPSRACLWLAVMQPAEADPPCPSPMTTCSTLAAPSSSRRRWTWTPQ